MMGSRGCGWILRGMACTATALLLSLPAAPPARAQTAISLHATESLKEPFSLLRGLRELPDGRLLVTDWIEERVALVDFAAGTVSNRGRVGQGPEEYRLPSGLFPWRGDSTVLDDQGNQRLAVLDRDGRVARILTLSDPSALYASAADHRGRLYYIIQPWLTRQPLPGDSVELAMFDPAAGQSQVLARLHGSTRAPQPGPRDGPRVPMVIYAKEDSWAISRSGSLAIVHGDDYTVELRAGANVVRGPSHAYRPLPVRDADRTAYMRRFAQGTPVSGKGPRGSLGHAPAEDMTPQAIAGLIRRSTWADVFPYFRAGDVRFDANDRLWVGHSTRTDEPLRYDIFNAAGRQIATVQLPAGRRLAGMGAKYVYLVATDDNDLQTLERAPLPMFPSSTR